VKTEDPTLCAIMLVSICPEQIGFDTIYIHSVSY